MIINTDFCMPGRPIVGTPQDAYRCFLASTIDLLVLENCIVEKLMRARQRFPESSSPSQSKARKGRRRPHRAKGRARGQLLNDMV
jgi:hypothetical protein